jgi:hypothetical protein
LMKRLHGQAVYAPEKQEPHHPSVFHDDGLTSCSWI